MNHRGAPLNKADIELIRFNCCNDAMVLMSVVWLPRCAVVLYKDDDL